MNKRSVTTGPADLTKKIDYFAIVKRHPEWKRDLNPINSFVDRVACHPDGIARVQSCAADLGRSFVKLCFSKKSIYQAPKFLEVKGVEFPCCPGRIDAVYAGRTESSNVSAKYCLLEPSMLIPWNRNSGENSSQVFTRQHLLLLLSFIYLSQKRIGSAGPERC